MHFFLLLLAFFLPLSAEEKKTICLNMIVKNETKVITRCLASVKPIIDYWVIVDTGSTDGTQNLIKEYMKDIPGELHERPWKNFEHNRNEALEFAHEKADYLLIMDADDRLEYNASFSLPSLTQDAYLFWIKFGGMSYQRYQLISSKLPWKWEGVLHEALTCAVQPSSATLDGITYVVSCDGARTQDPNKFRKDAAVLEAALKEQPDNTRYTFYLAQSYRDAGEYEKSIAWYQKRVEQGGWDQEVFWSVLQIGLCQKALGKPDDIVIDSLLAAYRRRPHRPEPVYYLAEIYRHQGHYELAYSLIKLREVAPKPATKDILFYQDWCEEYGIPFELSISSYYVGKYQESLDLCDTLLAMKDLPNAIREQTVKNRRFSVAKLAEPSQSASKPTIGTTEEAWAAG